MLCLTVTIYRRFVWPLISLLDAETAHERTLSALALAQRLPPGRALLKAIAGQLPERPVTAFGLTFPNLLGVAAGFDKEARVAGGLVDLGFGHVEVGTLTPQPQAGNPRPRIFRLPADGALINRMGFPNGGVAVALPRLQWLQGHRPDAIVGVSLGKQKETPLAEAAADYVAVMEAVYGHAGYLAVNVSSPNTPGLRELQGGDYLGQLLRELTAVRDRLAVAYGGVQRPLLLKIAPDLTWPEVDEILAAATTHGIAGIIAANTTTARPNLQDPNRSENGGLSGRPLAPRSREIVGYIARQSGLPVIGVGGVRTAVDVQMLLDAGASLVQLYTGLVYEGPGLAGRILRQLDARPAVH